MVKSESECRDSSPSRILETESDSWTIEGFEDGVVHATLRNKVSEGRVEEFLLELKSLVRVLRVRTTDPLTVHFFISEFPVPSSSIQARMLTNILNVDEYNVRLPIFVHSTKPERWRKLVSILFLNRYVRFE